MARRFGSGIHAGGQRVTDVASPTVTTDAATKSYVDSFVGAGSSMVFLGEAVWTAGAELTFSGIPQTFKHLKIIGTIAGDRATFANTGGRFRWNGITSNYVINYIAKSNGQAANAVQSDTLTAQASAYLGQAPAGTRGSAAFVSHFEILFPNYTNTSNAKNAIGQSHFYDAATTPGHGIYDFGASNPGNGAAITSFSVLMDSGNLAAGTRFSVYGVAESPSGGAGSLAPACRVYHNATQAIAAGGSGTLVAFNSERYDETGMHDTVTNNSRINIKVGGIYDVGASVNFAANGTGTVRALRIRRNGGPVIATETKPPVTGGTYGTGLTTHTTISLAAGDYLDVLVIQDSTVAAPGLTIAAGDAANAQDQCDFWATYRSPVYVGPPQTVTTLPSAPYIGQEVYYVVPGAGNTITNHVATPSFEHATPSTGWTTSDFGTAGSLTATYGSTEQAFAGTRSAKLVNTAAGQDDYIEVSVTGLTQNQVYNVSAYVRVTAFTAAATSSRGIFAYEPTNTGNAATATLTAANADWARLSVTLTPTAATTIAVRLYSPQATVYWDAVQVTQGVALQDYFDGSTTGTWSGTAHNSKSTRVVGTAGSKWHLRYDPAWTDTYKWDVISAQPIVARQNASVSPATTGSDLAFSDAAPQVALPLAGVYDLSYGAFMGHTGSNQGTSVAPRGTGLAYSADNAAQVTQPVGQNGTFVSASAETRAEGVSGTVELRYAMGVSGGSFSRRFLVATPVRVG